MKLGIFTCYFVEFLLFCCSIDKFKVMSSKMRPLWLEFENWDLRKVEGKLNNISLIFKRGDGANP